MYCLNCGKEVPIQAKFCRSCGASQVEQDPREPPPLPNSTESPANAAAPAASVPLQAPTPRVRVYASFGRRAGAFFIDGLVFLAALGTAMQENGNQPVWAALAPFATFWLYKTLLESSSWQATLGKRAFRIKVTNLAGERIGFGRATGRLFAQPLSYLILGLGYWMAAFTERRQTLHDLIAGTLVTQQSATPEEIAAAGAAPRSAGTAAVAIVVAVVGFIGVTGILAAISIPAYQNYTIRAQVSDALNHADGYKAAVSEAIAANTEAPLQTTAEGGALRLDPQNASRYTDSITVQMGTVIITFGGQANAKISGRRLAIYPALDANSDIIWVCGLARAPAGIDPAFVESQQRLTDVGTQYLPLSCHQ